MSQISVTLVRADTNQEFDVELPNDAPIGELVPALVKELGLPLTGPDGNQVAYEISNKRTGREFKEKETLDSGGAKQGDVLLLTSTFVAGAKAATTTYRYVAIGPSCWGAGDSLGKAIQAAKKNGSGEWQFLEAYRFPADREKDVKIREDGVIEWAADVDIKKLDKGGNDWGPPLAGVKPVAVADAEKAREAVKKVYPAVAEIHERAKSHYNRYDPDSKPPEHTPEQAAVLERVRVAFAAWQKAQTKLRQVKIPEKVEAARVECRTAEAAYRSVSEERDRLFGHLPQEPNGVRQEPEKKPKRVKPPSRPERWADAVARASQALDDLIELQGEYQEWLDNLPENLQSSAVGEKLNEIVNLDIEGAKSTIDDAENAELPRGFGKD